MLNEDGFGLAEVILSLLIFVIMGLGVGFIMQSDAAVTINNEHKLYAVDIANSAISDIRANSMETLGYSGVSVTSAGISGSSNPIITSSLSDSVNMMQNLPGGLLKITVTPLHGGVCPCSGTTSMSWNGNGRIEYFTLTSEVAQ